jgi:FkbM family methyltransferase
MMIAYQIEPFLKTIKGAIHVGANIGEEREWYDKMGFKSVLWFEPNKELVPILKDNVKKYSKHFVFSFGIHDTLTKGILHVANNNGQSSSILELGTHAINHPDVLHIWDQEIQLMRLDHFFEITGKKIENYNFLNVDVEGVELNVIKSFGDKIT